MAEAEISEAPEAEGDFPSRPGLSGDPDFRTWAGGLALNELSVWNETTAQLRHNYVAIWSSVKLFVTINGLVATVMGLLGRQAEYVQDGIVVGALALIGLTVNAIAVRLLYEQWIAYLGVLVRKTVLEHELGFHRTTVRGLDLSIPASGEVEGRSLDALLRDPRTWYARHRRTGGLFVLLCVMYGVIITVYLAALVMVAIGFISGYFFEGS